MSEINNENLPGQIGFGPTALDNDVSKLITELEVEYRAAEPTGGDEQPHAETPGTPEAAGNLSSITTKEALDTKVPVTDAKEDPTERGLERLVAREVELRERESRLSESAKEMEALRARLSELEPRAVTEDLLNKIKLSPSEGLRALGLDPDEVVRTALVEKLGEKANTPEMRETMERAKMRKEMEALKNQIRQAEMKRAAQEYFDKVDSGAREHAKNAEGLSKYAPTVASVAKTSPDRVHREIMEEITRDAAVRSSREPDGDVISYEEAASRIEKRWAEMKSLFGAPTPGPSVTPSGVASTPESKTPVVTQNPKPPPSTPKPPDRPLLPWLQASKDEEEAIKEAITEYRRLQK